MILHRIKSLLTRLFDRRVDIWQHQRHLMQISDQQLPEAPTLTATSILYLALTAEEMSEACVTAVGILAHEGMSSPRLRPAGGWGSNVDPRRQQLRNYLQQLASSWHQNAVTLRKLLAEQSHPLAIPLDPLDAISLLDDFTDIAVTVAGLTPASGLPGAEAYLDVQESNASKAHPLTGKIAKTADGKWIKGPRFRLPDLGKVLAQTRARKQKG